MKSIFIFLIFFISSCENKSQETNHLQSISTIHKKADDVESYIKGKNYNQNFCFLIDFSIPSHQYRFFVYDFKQNKIIEKALVAHGSGSENNGKNLKFSNIEGSYCSSLGKYAVGKSYIGSFGKSYRLIGLDSTNSNALKRAIVLHKLNCVPDKETNEPICLSLGCPMVSDNFFKILEKYIDHSPKKIILFAYFN